MLATVLSIFIPTLAVLVGILLNRTDATRLDGRITSLENRLDGCISSIENKLDSRISSFEGNVDGRISGLEGKLTAVENRLHSDMMLVMGN